MLSNKIYPQNPLSQNTEDLACQVLSLLIQRGETLATAESCTAGLIVAALGRIPGASKSLLGGLVTYTEDLKQSLLGVKAQSLASYGVVSEEVAGEMLMGLKDRLKPDLALSVTGLAGPGGGTEILAVGTVCFGLAYKDKIETWTSHFAGDRRQVQNAACQEALAKAVHILKHV